MPKFLKLLHIMFVRMLGIALQNCFCDVDVNTNYKCVLQLLQYLVRVSLRGFRLVSNVKLANELQALG